MAATVPAATNTTCSSVSCPFCECTVRHGTKNVKDLNTLTKLRLNIPIKCCMTGKGCDWQGELTQFWEHVSVCEQFPRPCPFDCDPNVFMPKQVLKDHLVDKCPLKRVPCEYKWAGCTEVCTRREMPRHMQDSAVLHNQLLDKAAKSYRNQISELHAEIDTLKGSDEISITSPRSDQSGLMRSSRKELNKPDKNVIASIPKRVKFDNTSTTIQSPTSLLPPTVEENKPTDSQTVPLGFITEEGRQYLKKAVECVSTPENTPSKKTKKVKERETISSPIVKYFYDVRSMGYNCPTDVCVYGKADWRTLMVKCGACENWYHSKCAKVNNHTATTLTHFTCTRCLLKEKNVT